MDTCNFSCEEFNLFRIDAPYPSVHTQPNRQYAVLVSGIFAGPGSESTAIAQYGSHRFMLNDYRDIYSAYKYLAATEMIHWQLLGELLLQLGAYPRLYSQEQKAWWQGSYPAYRTALGDILQADIEGERGAIAHYRRLIERIPLPDVQALFQRIILDEQRHLEILNSLFARYG